MVISLYAIFITLKIWTQTIASGTHLNSIRRLPKLARDNDKTCNRTRFLLQVLDDY
jgi:hypothetical protein